MNYQIMTVNEHGTKHFMGKLFVKYYKSVCNQKVLNGKIIMVLKINLMHFCNRFFDNETDNTVGIQFKTDDGALAVLCAQISGNFSEFRIFLAVLITLLLIISISLVIASTYSIIKPVTALKMQQLEL